MVIEQKNTSTGAGAAPNTKPNPDVDQEEVHSSGEPVDSVAVRDFYNESMVYVTEGSRYLYTPVEGQPYPYENLRPVDPKLDKQYRKEFEDFKRKKRDEIAARGSLKAMMRRASELDD